MPLSLADFLLPHLLSLMAAQLLDHKVCTFAGGASLAVARATSNSWSRVMVLARVCVCSRPLAARPEADAHCLLTTSPATRPSQHPARGAWEGKADDVLTDASSEGKDPPTRRT